MAGLVEIQQGILHSAAVEKVQQVKQESHIVHQQYSAVEMRQKDINKQQQVHETNKTDDARIRDRKKQKKKSKEDNKKDNDQKETILAAQGQSEQGVDIIA